MRNDIKSTSPLLPRWLSQVTIYQTSRHTRTHAFGPGCCVCATASLADDRKTMFCSPKKQKRNFVYSRCIATHVKLTKLQQLTLEPFAPLYIPMTDKHPFLLPSIPPPQDLHPVSDLRWSLPKLSFVRTKAQELLMTSC